MKNLFLSTVAALAIAGAPMTAFAQDAGGAKKEMSGGSSGSGDRSGGGGMDSSGGGRAESGGGRMDSGSGAPAGGAGAGGGQGERSESGAGSRQDSGAGGSSEMKSGSGMEEKSGAGMKDDAGRGAKDGSGSGGQMKSGGDRSGSTGAGDGKPGRDGELKSGSDRDRSDGAGMKAGEKERDGKDGARNSPGGSSKTSVKVTSEQKTTIRQKLVVSGGGARVSKSSLGGVSISVGVKLPREKVRISRLPSEIIQIVPEYSDYEYFVTDDGLIVIVDPDTYEIVDVIEA